jgi:hypothetical protein
MERPVMKCELPQIATAALVFVVAGCSGPVTSAPTVTPTPTVAPSPTAACSADEVMRQVDQLLAGQEHESFYLTINEELSLSFYLVDPEIDPTASITGLVDGNREALERGLWASYQMIDRIPCVRGVFQNINPMIVDRRYQTWYVDIIPIRDFVGMDEPTPAELVEAMQRSGARLASGRRYPPRPGDEPAPSGACTWPEARAVIQNLFGAGERNTAAYLLIGNLSAQAPWDSHTTPNVVVQAQWDIDSLAEATDAAVLRGLQPLAQALACLSPHVDQLEVFVVDQTGWLVVYAVVPGTLIGQGAQLSPDSVFLYHTD